MKFVVSLAFSPPSELCRLARAADEAGFAAAAISDHLVHPRNIKTPYPYTEDGSLRWEPFTPWPDPWVAIAAMAAVTERLRFFTSVYVLAMRNPFAVAKAVATAAAVSNDRVGLGIGAGWMKDEFLLMEQDFHTRGRRTDEMIAVLRKLWSGGWVEHHGKYYDFDELEMSPAPAAEIPIYVGGISKAALRRAATLGDGWISDVHSTAELRSINKQLAELRADSDLADRPFEVFGVADDAFDLDGYKRLQEAGVTHLMTMPWFFYPNGDSLQGKCEAMNRFRDDILSKFP